MSPVFDHGALRLYLLKLLEAQPRHGYNLMQEVRGAFEGMYMPSAGTIYPRLARLEADGLIEALSDESGRKTYRLTDLGRAELRERAGDVVDLEARITGSVRQMAEEIKSDVRASVKDLRGELKDAMKQARREARGSARDISAELSAELDRFTREVSTKLVSLSTTQLAELRSTLKETTETLVERFGRKG